MWDALAQVFATLMAARPAFVAAALGLYAVSVLIAGARWRGVLRALGHRVSLGRVLLINLSGIFVNNTTPASRLGGEACRVALIRQTSAVPTGQAAVSVACDRASDALPVVAIALIALPAARALRFSRWGLAVLGVAALLVAFAAWRWFRHRSRPPEKGSRVWPSLKECWAALPPAVGWSSLIWAQDIARISMVAAACHVSLTVAQAATLSVIAVLGGLAPTIGGLGVIEAGLLGGLLAFGVRSDAAGAIVALERAISYGAGTVAGGIAASLMGGRLLWTVSRLRSSATGSPRE